MYGSNPWLNPDTNEYYGGSQNNSIFGQYSKYIPGLASSAINAYGASNYQNPSSSANDFLSQIAPTITPYYKPYSDAGINALPQFQDQISSLLRNGQSVQDQFSSLATNPGQKINEFGSQFQQSPGFNWALKQALAAGDNAAAAGGMAGSPMHQQQNMGVAQGLASQDYEAFLSHILSLFGMGLQGQQGLYGSGISGLNNITQGGLQAGMGLGDNLATALAGQAKNAYSGQQSANESSAGGFGDLASIASTVLGFL